MQHFATALHNEVFNPAIGISPGVHKNYTAIMRPDKLMRPEELLSLIDAARWESKTLWEVFGSDGLWGGTAEQLKHLLRGSSVAGEIEWTLAAGNQLGRLLGHLRDIAPNGGKSAPQNRGVGLLLLLWEIVIPVIRQTFPTT